VLFLTGGTLKFSIRFKATGKQSRIMLYSLYTSTIGIKHFTRILLCVSFERKTSTKYKCNKLHFHYFYAALTDKWHTSARIHGLWKTLQKEKKQVPKHEERISLLSSMGCIVLQLALKIFPVSS